MESVHLSKFTALLILLVAVVAFLAGTYARPYLGTEQTNGTIALNAAAGRYTLVINPTIKNEKFLLDSQTGKIWQVLKSGEKPDKSFVCHSIEKIEESESPPTAKISNLKVNKNHLAKIKMVARKPTASALSDDNVTIEVISSGKVSRTRVPKALPCEKTESNSILSTKSPLQAQANLEEWQ